MADARIEEIRKLLPQAMLPDWVRLGSRLVRLLRDQHHPDAHEALLNRLLAQAKSSVALRQHRASQLPTLTYPPALPITARKDEIVAAIRANQVVIIAGETGSGKTTQIPKMCLEAGLGIEAKIGCTQPRRIAALSISRRIAEELNVTWGCEVGCKIRFDDHSSPDTYIKLMTDGILLAETQGDPLLCEYNVLIVDEAHERSLNIDFLLGYLKGLLAKRPELKLIVTSATIDTDAFSHAFNNAPVIEVSGRLYPVEIIYEPFDPASEESGEMTFIDAAVGATEQVMSAPGSGDVLIFMPGERDIRETSDLLKGRFSDQAEIIPLFGRLSSGDQQRVFSAASRRKIVVATNIAETSLTIPGIRYVIDSGLARISRYNPRTRIKRLPIEPIAQSSANQRKGRSGRVQNGVCIRLYSEEDFAGRPAFTQPEIQRANLAEVILRMKAFRLGEIETFPFINPPSPASIQGGYKLLQELGALDENRDLTSMGRDLARLPIDPTLGRMLLQAQREHATRELLIIASGLSIQDPRERPLDQKDAAASAHKRFSDPKSDFLTLLNIWNAVHDQWETLRTQSQRRKFCKSNFLSYVRMREWQDLHAQLHDALEELGTLKINESNAAYEAIHRSILAGLLGHVATREERNLYKAAGNRHLNIFPGSALFDRVENSKKTRARPRSGDPSLAPQTHRPEWLVAGEIVETSQLFARTLAGIDPLWVVDLAPHICKVTHHNPRWDPAAGRVLVDEKLTLYGLEVHQRKAAYGNINPKAATEIFIRSALVEWSADAPVRKFENSAPAPYRFLEHNRQIRQKIEIWQTRMRRHDLADLDQALFDFYAKRIENISSVHELNRLLGEQHEANFLCVTETDLIGNEVLHYDSTAFPDAVPLGGQSVPLSYSYSPGEDHDGVTVKVDLHLAQALSQGAIEWAVPGLREGQIAELLRALPKSIRKQLMPLPPKVAEIARELRPAGNSVKHELARFIHRHYGIEVPLSAWPADAVPKHLRPRIELIGQDQKPLGAGRDLVQLRQQLEKIKIEPVAAPHAWIELTQKWERFGLTAWTFGDLPEGISHEPTPSIADNAISLSSSGGEGRGEEALTHSDATPPRHPGHPHATPAPIHAWPGLQLEQDQVNLRLFHTPEAARDASLGGIQRLVEIAVQKDLAWLQKDLRALARLEPLCTGLCSSDELQTTAFENLKRSLLPAAPFLTRSHFQAAVDQVRQRLPGLASQFIDLVETILKLRQEILRRYAIPSKPLPVRDLRLAALNQLQAPASQPPKTSIAHKELHSLLPKNFLETIPFSRLPHLPRYLKALLIRAERAAMNPLKDQERARQLVPYLEALRKLHTAPPRSISARQRLGEFRWMLEEFKVSLFAQELGTPFPISPKRLDQHLAQLLRDLA